MLPGVIEQMIPQADLARFPAYANSRFILNPGDDPALRPIGALGMLAASGGRSVGHLRVAEVDCPPAPPAPLVVTPDLLGAKGRDGEDVFYELVNEAVNIPGVAGMRPKLLATMADSLPHDPNVRSFALDTHIIKIGGDIHEQYLPVVEYACMRAAKAAGLAVAEVLLSEDGKLLSVERFDLSAPDAEGNRTALRLEELCGVMKLPGSKQYESTVEKVAAQVGALGNFVPGWHVSEQQREANLKRVFEQMVMHASVRNGDFHLKNWALLHRGYGTPVSVSPLYDVVTTQPFIEARMVKAGMKEEPIALPLGNQATWTRMAQRLMSFGLYHCHLEYFTAVEIMERVAQGVRDHRSELREMSSMGVGAADLITKVDRQWDLGTAELLRMATASRRVHAEVVSSRDADAEPAPVLQPTPTDAPTI